MMHWPFFLLFLFPSALPAKKVPEGPYREGAPRVYNIDVGEQLLEIISPKYRLGRFLIYDCEEKHFACVDKKGFEECQKERKDVQEREKVWLPCAPLKEFTLEKDCYDKQLQVIQKNQPTPFCKTEPVLHQTVR